VIEKKVKVDSKDNEASEKNNSSSNSNASDHDIPECKKEPEKTNLHEMSDEEDGDGEGQKVKAESGKSSDNKPHNADRTGDLGASVTNEGAANRQKEKCMYGTKCYR